MASAIDWMELSTGSMSTSSWSLSSTTVSFEAGSSASAAQRESTSSRRASRQSSLDVFTGGADVGTSSSTEIYCSAESPSIPSIC